MQKKIVAALVIMILTVGSVFNVSADSINTSEAFKEQYPTAPVIAGLLLEKAGIDNRYGTGKDGGNHIRDVALHMGPETDFNGVSREDTLAYSIEVAEFLINKGVQVRHPGIGIPDPEASSATSVNNYDGTVTLTLTVIDILGNFVTDLNPLTDIYVMDLHDGGPFYFGTDDIPGSENWVCSDGTYVLTLDRNYFDGRPFMLIAPTEPSDPPTYVYNPVYPGGWSRFWDIYVRSTMIQENLLMMSFYKMEGSWDLTLRDQTGSIVGQGEISFPATVIPEPFNFPGWPQSTCGLIVQYEIDSNDEHFMEMTWYFEDAGSCPDWYDGDCFEWWGSGDFYFRGEIQPDNNSFSGYFLTPFSNNESDGTWFMTRVVEE